MNDQAAANTLLAAAGGMPFAAVDPILGVIAVAVAGPLVTYLLAARRLSGRVGSSEASELWAESRSIREWSQARIEALNVEVEVLRTRIGLVEQQNDALARENGQLMQQIRDLSSTITELRAEIVALTTELKAARARVVELEAEEGPGG